ncbi:MAG: hypothetical protein MJZ77_03990 [Bacteroidales bacterium]|nr:hypothetical protein [Bacteroidales bacterium]
MKQYIFLFLILAAFVGHAQDTATFWQRSQVGLEFSHNVNRAYTYVPGILRHHPNNYLNITASYSLGRCWSLGGYIGFHAARKFSEVSSRQIYEGCTTTRIEDTPQLAFGLEASFHILPLLKQGYNPFDLFLNAKLGHTMQDIELGYGFGLGYRPIPRLEIYGKANWGMIGFPYGMLQQDEPHLQLRFGASFNL